MTDQNTHPDAYAGDERSQSSDRSGNVADSNENLSLAEINTMLGKDFKDKKTALSSLKDTQNYALKNANEKAILESNLKDAKQDSARIKQIEIELFYTNNPQYKPYKDTIAAMGSNPAEVVEKENFKKIFTDLAEFEKTKSAKSVLQSNPRIGQAKTRIEEAKELSGKGKQSDANRVATEAVLEAYKS